MIELRFIRPHRSIAELPTTALPDFTIVTGINGSGKSHLLEAIENGSVKAEGTTINSGQVLRFDWNTLVPRTENPVDPNGLVRSRATLIQNAFEFFKVIKDNSRKNIVSTIEQLKITGLPIDDEKFLLTLNEPLFRQYVGEPQMRHWPQKKHIIDNLTSGNFQIRLNQNNLDGRLLKYLLKRCGQQPNSAIFLSLEEIDKLIPIDWTPVDIFQHSLSELFAAYHRAWEENLQHDYYNNRYGESHRVFTKDEFEEYFGGPPWGFLNKILEEAGLDFRAVYPEGRADLMFQVKLKSRTTGAEVLFKDLSSGEKIIMSFALCIYRVQRQMLSIDNYPKLLLFDEIDAPLHPSMTRGLISAIQNVLVKKKGIIVILTTHSPATVAFAPTDALYRLEKYPRKLVQCTKDEAIQTLTSGYISVTDNSRFVLVEAQQDKVFYTGVYKKLVDRDRLPISPNLVFLPASLEKHYDSGGREKVKQWSSKLSQAGLTQIFGLIDRDDGNVATTNVKVLQRYSIENYILDPINVYTFLIDEQKHSAVLDLGIKDCDYRQLKDIADGDLQRVADLICRQIESANPGLAQNSKGRFDVQYICRKTISLPGWMRDHPGHKLVALYRECFKTLVGNDFILTRNDCGDLLSMLTNRFPDFIPIELIDTLKELYPNS